MLDTMDPDKDLANNYGYDQRKMLYCVSTEGAKENT